MRATSACPEGLVVASYVGGTGEGIVEGGVEGAEERHDLMAETVAGEGEVAVGGVFAPGLVAFGEEAFDGGAAGVEEGTEDEGLGWLRLGSLNPHLRGEMWGTRRWRGPAGKIGAIRRTQIPFGNDK